MKHLLAMAAAVAFAAAAVPAFAETAKRTHAQGAREIDGRFRQAAGDGHHERRRARYDRPEHGGNPGNRGSSGASGPKGPPKRMGDEGKLPATKNMSGAVPEMTPPADK